MRLNPSLLSNMSPNFIFIAVSVGIFRRLPSGSFGIPGGAQHPLIKGRALVLLVSLPLKTIQLEA